MVSDKSVLILDDDASIRLSLSCHFEDRGWRVAAAESGEAALDAIQDDLPKVFVVDIRLGGMPGDAFIREALLRLQRAMFIVCTGSSEYALPPDLSDNVRVSPKVFIKPVLDLSSIETEALRLFFALTHNQQES